MSSNVMNIEIPKKPANKSASEHRRATKPIMEKRRRARINHSLNELKSLILDAMNKDPSRHSKLEKADILEMTVRHLQSLQKQQFAIEISRDPTVMNKFAGGYTECATEVGRYLQKMDGVDTGLKSRVMNHLSSCLESVSHAAGPQSSSYPQLQIQIPFQHQRSQGAPSSTFSSASSSGSSSIQLPVNLSTASASDINNNHHQRLIRSAAAGGPPDAKMMRLTPPASATSQFSFSFAASSPAPTTPSTPGTSASGYNFYAQSGHSLPDFMFTSAAHLWPSRSNLGSVSPGSSSSLGSLSPGSDFSVDTSSTSASSSAPVVTGTKRSFLSSSAGSDVWRPW